MNKYALTKSQTKKLVLGIFIVVFALGFWMFWPEYQKSQLIKHGLPATATILKIESTGNRLNDQPEVKLELKVNLPEGREYIAQTKTYVSPVYLVHFQRGKELNIRYDPKNLQRIAVSGFKY